MEETDGGGCKWGGTMGTNGSRASARGAAFNLIVLRSNRDRDQWYSTVIFRSYGGDRCENRSRKMPETARHSGEICIFKAGNSFLLFLLLLLLLFLSNFRIRLCAFNENSSVERYRFDPFDWIGLANFASNSVPIYF